MGSNIPAAIFGKPSVTSSVSPRAPPRFIVLDHQEPNKMFARKDKITRSLTEIGNGDSPQETTTRHSAKGVYGLKKCHDAPDAVAE
jgi:hypothetical protein